MSARASTAAGRRRTGPPKAPAPAKRATKPSRPKPSRPRQTRAAASSGRSGAGALALPRLPSISLPRPHLPTRLPSTGAVRIVVLLLALLVAAYFGWFRHSSFVSAKHVTVDGATTSDSEQIVAALTAAGHEQSTLDVDVGSLQAAVASFPTVASVSADTHFPSGLTIHVTPRPPAMLASDGSSQVPVAADGTILTGLELSKDQISSLPVLHVKTVHETGSLGGSPLARALVVGAAPAPLRPLIEDAGTDPDTGITVTMHGGFRIEFGDSDAARRKWAAAAAVLADPKLDALTYVDVRLPERPAVGGN